MYRVLYHLILSVESTENLCANRIRLSQVKKGVNGRDTA